MLYNSFGQPAGINLVHFIMAAPDDQEKKLIAQFRNRVRDVLDTDERKSAPFLLRWIRAREHNLDKAEEMLRKSLKWRKEYDVDNVLKKPFDPWFTKEFPYWTGSRDKLGNPTMEIPLGAWDVRKAMDPEHESQFYAHVCRFYEDVMLSIKDANDKAKLPSGSWPITQWTVILDFKNYSYAQFLHLKALQNTMKLAATYEAHYPEILHAAIFVNCPSIMPLFMAVLRKFISPRTMAKCKTFGGEAEWKPFLMEMIGEDELGHMFGGKQQRMILGKKYNPSGKLDKETPDEKEVNAVDLEKLPIS